MALVNISAGLWYPYPYQHNLSFPTNTLDGSGEKHSGVIRVPKTGTLDKIEIRSGAITTFPANGIRISFQDPILTSGFPDEVQDQYRDITVNPGANAWVIPGLMTSDGTDTGVKRSVTKGDLLSYVVEQVNSADTWNMIISNVGASGLYIPRFPYIVNKILPGPNWATVAGHLMCALKYSDGSYPAIPFVHPYLALTGTTINSGTSPDEVALYFSLPSKFTVKGFLVYLDLDENTDIVLYDSDGSTVLASLTLDKDLRGATSAGGFAVYFPTETATLLANTFYRLAIKPLTITNITYQFLTVNSNAMFEMMDGGINMYWSERTDGGAWAETNTKRPFILPIIGQIDDGAGGGGGETFTGTLINRGIN